MKSKILFLLLLIIIFALQFGCGGGGGTSFDGSSTTRVEITIGRTQTASQESGTLLRETDQIPSSIAQIRITITGPDMQTILRTIPATGRTVITESFEVPVGSGRRFLVEALDSAGFVIFQGETLANVGAAPVSLTISMVNTDPVTPIFAGLSTASYTNSVLTLTWQPASDNVTAQSRIQYLIFASTTPGGENFSATPFDVTTGTTSYTKTGVNFSGPQYFVVRARDENGNTDSNTQERSVNALIDLSISGVQRAVEGWDLTYTVNNTGTLDANNVTVYVVYSDFYVSDCTPQTVTVPAGGSVTVTTIGSMYPDTYKIIADPTNAFSESSETNNINCFNSGDSLCLAPTPTSCVIPQ